MDPQQFDPQQAAAKRIQASASGATASSPRELGSKRAKEEEPAREVTAAPTVT